MFGYRQEEEEEDESCRGHQLNLLRQLCLPLICFLLHNVLHSTEQYKQVSASLHLQGILEYILWNVQTFGGLTQGILSTS